MTIAGKWSTIVGKCSRGNLPSSLSMASSQTRPTFPFSELQMTKSSTPQHCHLQRARFGFEVYLWHRKSSLARLHSLPSSLAATTSCQRLVLGKVTLLLYQALLGSNSVVYKLFRSQEAFAAEESVLGLALLSPLAAAGRIPKLVAKSPADWVLVIAPLATQLARHPSSSSPCLTGTPHI